MSRQADARTASSILYTLAVGSVSTHRPWPRQLFAGWAASEPEFPGAARTGTARAEALAWGLPSAANLFDPNGRDRGIRTPAPCSQKRGKLSKFTSLSVSSRVVRCALTMTHRTRAVCLVATKRLPPATHGTTGCGPTPVLRRSRVSFCHQSQATARARSMASTKRTRVGLVRLFLDP